MNSPAVEYYKNYHGLLFKETDLIKIEVGQSYRVKVKLKNGVQIISEYETILQTPDDEVELNFQADTVLVQRITEEIVEVPIVQFSAKSSVEIRGEERKSKLFWTAERTFKVTDSLNVPNFESKVCYITVNLDFDDIHLLDGNTLTTNEVNELPLSRVILDAEFAEGYYYTTYRKALTDEAFDYFSKVKRVVERTGSMFESPVGLLPTNLSNADDPKDTDVYGYFTAYQQDTFRLYVSPESVGNPSKFCPPIIVFCPNICCNCLSELGSQIIKPDFWIE